MATRSALVGFAAITVAVAGVVATGTPANAAPQRAQSSNLIVLPVANSNVKFTVPRNWQSVPVTTPQRKYHFGPSELHAVGVPIAKVVPVPSGVQPLSTQKCKAGQTQGDITNICLNVKGVGLNVETWKTFAQIVDGPTGIETFAVFLVNGKITSTSNDIFIDAPGMGTAYYYKSNFDEPNGTVFCNEWYDFPGKPCATIHD